MKIISLLFVICLFEDSICNNDLLSKFYQNGYKVKDVWIQLINYDKSYCEFLKLVTFKYNRTTTAHNATLKLKKDLYDRSEVLFQAFKFLSNEYRHFPIRFQVNLNKAFQANVGGTLKATRCGNLTSCYFYKDVIYHICNFVVDETYLPLLIPNGKYKAEVHILYLNQPITEIHVYGEVYTPTDYSTE